MTQEQQQSDRQNLGLITRAERWPTPPRSWSLPDTHYLRLLHDSWYSLLLRLFDGFQYATSAFWRERGVLAAALPITTGAVSSPMGLGSDSSPVRIEIQGISTYLADSQQFALELMCRLAKTGCYYIMPSFRGEANDERHLGQFVHSEAELSGDLANIQKTVEDYLRSLARFFLKEFAADIAAAAGTTAHVETLAMTSRPFQSIRFAEAVTILGDYADGITVDADGTWRTLSSAGERELLRRLGQFTWVTHFDELAVPFYQAVEDDGTGRQVARNADLLFGIGETVGAGERHVTGMAVRDAIQRHGLSQHAYEWYITMRDKTPMLTSGFGMGVERFLLWLLDHNDVRDMMMLVRSNGVSILP